MMVGSSLDGWQNRCSRVDGWMDGWYLLEQMGTLADLKEGERAMNFAEVLFIQVKRWWLSS